MRPEDEEDVDNEGDEGQPESKIPDLDDDDHPLARGAFTCPSKPMERVCATLKGALKFNFPSIVFSGERRLGKTWCCQFISRNPRRALGRAYPILMHRCRSPDRRLLESAFHNHLLTSFGSKLITGTPENRYRRLLHLIIDKAASHRHRKIVMILDEAHRLTAREYEWLITIHNDVEKYAKIIYLLAGQPELANRRSEYQAEGAKQITGRFMAEGLEYTGLTNWKEVQYSAAQFDTELVWPRRSGISYSEYYAGEAFRAKWRYASHAKAIWNAFEKVRPDVATIGISMQSFVGVTGYLFRAKAAQRPDFKGFSTDDIEEAIAFIAYLEAQERAEEEQDADE